MITMLAKIFIKNRPAKEQRQAYGTLCSIVGICLNVCLFAGKYFAGMLSGSVAITADAFNNLSDAGSSFITLAGFLYAGKTPDSEHPFGHGRFEYVSGFVVAIAILMMGFELLKTSFSKILHPEAGAERKEKRRCMERDCSGDSCGRRCGKYHDFCV